MFFGPVAALGGVGSHQNGMTTAANIETIFEKKRRDVCSNRCCAPKQFRGEVIFKDVYFRYRPGQPLVLHDISFETKQGQSIALVRESGVGKSWPYP